MWKPSLVLRKIRGLKKVLMQNSIKGVVASWARMHLVKLPTCKEERPKESSAPKCRKVCSTKE